MINIDLTTKNTVYNTLGPQAQWIQHRFGRRDYPDIDLDSNIVLNILKCCNDTVNLNSHYGDPSSYPQIIKIVKEIKDGRCVFNSHLSFKNDKLISLLNEKNAYVVVPIFGIDDLHNKIVLYSDWDLVLDNIKNLNCKVCLEFYIYEFNKHQINKIKTLFSKNNIEIKIREGISLHPSGFSTIVDDLGNWLYDVYNSGTLELNQTVNGYNSLIQFIKPVRGKSILDNPLFYEIHTTTKYDTVKSIAVTGQVFESFELSRIFSNALCSDWNLSLSKITNVHESYVNEDLKILCSQITKIFYQLKNNNNIYNKDFDDILANFANSDI